uniref:Uncharacterized protein n=1 Tax=Anguilla anguilla TaxID=7936 RepID=A0A0E9T8S7_ANGAN
MQCLHPCAEYTTYKTECSSSVFYICVSSEFQMKYFKSTMCRLKS